MGQRIYFDSDKIEFGLTQMSSLINDFLDDNEEWKKIISDCQNQKIELGYLGKNITKKFQIVNELLENKQNELLKICEVYFRYENINKEMVEKLSVISLKEISNSQIISYSPVDGWTGKICPQILFNTSMVIETWLYKYLINQDE